MGELQLLLEADPVTPPHSPCGGTPLADTVEGENGCLVERAGEEGTGGMALMVIEEDDGSLGGAGQTQTDLLAGMEFLLEPDGQGHAEAAQPGGGEGEVRFHQPLELGERFVVEGNVIEILGR